MTKRMTAQEVGDSMIRNGYTAVRATDDPDAVDFVPPPERTIPTKNWRVLQRNKWWVKGCTITESVRLVPSREQTYRRFTATIRGWNNFKVWEGYIDRPANEIAAEVIRLVTAIRDRIDNGDESDFYRKNQPAKEQA